MATSRPETPVDPLRFGRRTSARAEALSIPERELQDDVRLFVATFAAGFLFVSILIA